ncbi:MAG: peptidoglycan recognition protein family protein [Planctomycetes bacterium]|nr:peptidoglycan recognition protein family protein [Planctomycetota bacterium]
MPRCGRISPRWTSIVVHHSATSAGGAQRFNEYHTKGRGWDELGYHFVIGNGTDTPDGYIEVGSRWHKQKHGAHCKTTNNYYNDHGIGVCLVGNFNESRPTPRQLASLERLGRYLCRTCGISPQRVVTHHNVNGHTECPGRNFHVDALRRALGSPSFATSLP